MNDDGLQERHSANDTRAVLTLDLGSTWLKGAWADVNGGLRKIERRPSPLWDGEKDAEAVWNAVLDFVRHLCRSPEAPSRACAVSMTAVTRTHVFVDAAGQPLSPLVLWSDAYGDSQASTLAQAYGATEQARGFGGYHPLARMLQFQHDHGQRPHAMLELKDWLNFKLTGRMAIDTVAHARLVPLPGDGAYSAPSSAGDAAILPSAASGVRTVLGRLGLPSAVVPEAVPPVALVGRVPQDGIDAGGLLAGVPVVTGSFDTWSATLGMGAIEDGGAYDISGTTQVLGTFSRQLRVVEGMISIPWTPEFWQTGGPCHTGLATLAWFARTFLNEGDPAATLSAAEASRSPDVPLCLPYLSGERMPLWNSGLSASFVKARAHHTRNDFAKGLVEGLALAHRLALDALGVRQLGKTLHMSGGGTRHPYWCRVRADAFGMPVKTVASSESALVGCALAAGIALGVHADISEAQSIVQENGKVILPDRGRMEYFDHRAKAFSSMLQQELSS